ncbi:ATP-binding protein [Streptococcus sanguinis]|uniref:ATP-binding protein n=1 Tax=Streptococcus sanguinis TaxID=1305 RepID=UPI001CBBBCA0|nr:ATP-binding protein [Streptococcus sanguinis]MBZ2038108.1 ATP-binding protein [Streptococcus sanguinis]MBZ2069019.1 ATP-binding protein [Streptococcus sanguinis]MBZ2070490.1 ATP-binding protein [Streptococcus sanguinis]
MDLNIKKFGVIVGVDGDISQVGMYQMSNDTEYFWYGDLLQGAKIGAYLTILQNDIKIIANVVTEKIADQQNTIRSTEFDNRYSKNSINRIVHLKTKGVIENNSFQVTSQYVPMIGNEVCITSKKDLELIYGVDTDEPTITVGKSILEGQSVPLSINKFFASHIGVFGNTGSGKSNTLHKVFLELFRSEYQEKILEISKFYVIDFNGEYIKSDSFGVTGINKKVFDINTRSQTSNKIPITSDYLFDPDILSILFGATIATQVPFLRKALKIWEEKKFDGTSIARFVVGTLKKILTTGNSASLDSKDNWTSVAEKYINSDLFTVLKSNLYYNSACESYFTKRNGCTCYIINPNTPIESSEIRYLRINEIEEALCNKFDALPEIDKLRFHLDFQKVHQSAWKSTNIEHINPLFHRIDTALNSLKNVVEVKEDITRDFSSVNIINLVHANQEITRLIPMLISKMVYDQQKLQAAGNDVTTTSHLIIDEAHNILNGQNHSLGDTWQDYRLSIFEEIIKEGRKFGFYLTLSSQRPADISPTILSQVHNYFIHRLVNDNDLRMLVNTMPTLDKSSFSKIPSLGKGEVIITGNAIQVPVFVKVDKEEVIRPNSDDVILTELWSRNDGKS